MPEDLSDNPFGEELDKPKSKPDNGNAEPGGKPEVKPGGEDDSEDPLGGTGDAEPEDEDTSPLTGGGKDPDPKPIKDTKNPVEKPVDDKTPGNKPVKKPVNEKKPVKKPDEPFITIPDFWQQQVPQPKPDPLYQTPIVGLEGARGQTIYAHLEVVKSSRDLARQLNVRLSGSANWGVSSINAKAEFANQATFSESSVVLAGRVSIVHETVAVGIDDFILSERARQILRGPNGPVEFYKLFGDGFIQSITTGAELLLIVTVTTKSEEDKMVMAAELSGKNALVEVEGKLRLQLGSRQKSSEVVVDVMMIGVGDPAKQGVRLPMDEAGALETFQNFPRLTSPEVGGGKPLSFTVAEYGMVWIGDNGPPVNFLSSMGTAEILETVALELFDSRALVARLDALSNFTGNPAGTYAVTLKRLGGEARRLVEALETLGSDMADDPLQTATRARTELKALQQTLKSLVSQVPRRGHEEDRDAFRHVSDTTTRTQPDHDISVQRDVPTAKVVGCGARLDDVNTGGNCFLRAAFSEGGGARALATVRAWDSRLSHAAPLSVFAILMNDPDDLWEQVTVQMEHAHPVSEGELTAELPEGFILTGGGAMILRYGFDRPEGGVPGEDCLLTASYPVDKRRWRAAMGSDDGASQRLRVFATGIRPRPESGLTPPEWRLFARESPLAEWNAEEVLADAGWLAVSGGARVFGHVFRGEWQRYQYLVNCHPIGKEGRIAGWRGSCGPNWANSLRQGEARLEVRLIGLRFSA